MFNESNVYLQKLPNKLGDCGNFLELCWVPGVCNLCKISIHTEHHFLSWEVCDLQVAGTLKGRLGLKQSKQSDSSWFK